MLEKSPQFAHLHQHTAYSLLDGAARIKDLISWVKEVTPENPSIAITDHGNMHGVIEFYKTAGSMGVKPIIGLEAYVTAGSRFEKKKGSSKLDGGYFHLTLLAKDFKGYQNLCKLTSKGWIEGFYSKPRVDHELLKEHSEGIIAMSGCLGAQIPRMLLDVGFAAGETMLQNYLEIYKDNFFIELQNHIPENLDDANPKLTELVEQQGKLNPMLRELANKYGLGMVATNDGHYVKKEDAKAHEALLAIQTKTTLSDSKRFRFPCEEFYVKTPKEMAKAIPETEYPSALANTMVVADMCNVELPIGNKKVYQMPEIPIPEGRTLAEQLRVQTYEGLMQRYKVITEEFYGDYFNCIESRQAKDLEETLLGVARAGEKHRMPKAEGDNFDTYQYPHLEKFKETNADEETLKILERTEYELGVIIAMGFPDYFLIVADFINWAKSQGIAVGPGRGSGAGSIVAYALGITNIDPLEFDLLFERFLNPERVSMPDFDIDFSDVRRGEVIDYVRRKYGDEKVAHIATFGTMASKAAIKDAARVLEAPYADADAAAKLIPVVFGRSTPIAKAMTEVKELKDLYDGVAKEFMDVAITLEGLTRHASVHAAGVIIARRPIQELAPVFKSGDVTVCQYDMSSIEDLGFLKMDFLGLRTLSLIEAAVKIVKESRGIELIPDEFTANDPETMNLLGQGKAAGVFQFEGGGMVDTLKRLKPNHIEDLIAVSALYRPGPMENIPTYIRRHHGVEEVKYKEFPNAERFLKPILEKTYGIPVYQEQIMQIAQAVAAYSLGEADLLRRAMGKKKVEEMAKQRELFEKGASQNNIPKDEARAIFDLLEKFANYGFNRSHAAAYGALSYQTAYLKAHYPTEFTAALLTVERANSDKVAEYVTAAKGIAVSVLPPDINESGSDFTPVGKVVRFGLYGIKNVGDNAVENILSERRKGGKFKSLYDFCQRVDSKVINKRAVEHLIKAGAFDGLDERHVMLANYEAALKWGTTQREQSQGGQLGLFAVEEVQPPTLIPAEALGKLELLKMEKDALGLYISDHPMNSYPGLADSASCKLEELEQWYKTNATNGKARVILAGIMQNVVKRSTKSGNMMARFEIADTSSSYEFLAFSRVYEEIATKLAEDVPVVAVIEISPDGESGWRLVVEKLIRWDAKEDLPEVAIIEFTLSEANDEKLEKLRSRIDEFVGITPLQLKVKTPEGIHNIETNNIRLSTDHLKTLEDSFSWLKSKVAIDRNSLLKPRNNFKGKKENKEESQTEVPF